MTQTLRVEDVRAESIDTLLELCIPLERRNDKYFIEGAHLKSDWVIESINRFGSVAKIAYLGSKPAGLIQYLPDPSEGIVEIKCIFVPDKLDQRKGVGRALMKDLIGDLRKGLFDLYSPSALVTWAFQVPGYYPQNEFYLRMGFKRVREDDPFLLYYPLKEGFRYSPIDRKYTPLPEDKGRALIFYDPSCPFRMYFAGCMESLIREVAPDLCIRMINTFKEPEEVRRRGEVPPCVVNGIPISSFFLDGENFKKEVENALRDNPRGSEGKYL
ncbi:MAG: GNAT family N-acetyltransferase [Candidatus Korarchaeum sp.]